MEEDEIDKAIKQNSNMVNAFNELSELRKEIIGDLNTILTTNDLLLDNNYAYKTKALNDEMSKEDFISAINDNMECLNKINELILGLLN